jgi:hypothetical protein
MSAHTEVTVMNLISQGQIATSQRKVFEGFVAGVAVAALAIALAWGAFAVVNTSKTIAPSATSIEYLQEPGLMEQRAGERGGAVAIPSTKTTVSGDSVLEQLRRERSAGSQAVPKQHGNGLLHGPLR